MSGKCKFIFIKATANCRSMKIISFLRQGNLSGVHLLSSLFIITYLHSSLCNNVKKRFCTSIGSYQLRERENGLGLSLEHGSFKERGFA